ncbi:uncharacterized protein TrAFT101_006961 [Trichoderma asperellum]|uniref:uncharacterized protein n=1 Tax=Trichoderma asperellum TaxID=101201 RepID=UPI003328A7B4|nr:hypothetical protein TrAFT101_006961 [Trichoderma asperellum]
MDISLASYSDLVVSRRGMAVGCKATKRVSAVPGSVFRRWRQRPIMLIMRAPPPECQKYGAERGHRHGKKGCLTPD